jgi:hypothetical protein
MAREITSSRLSGDGRSFSGACILLGLFASLVAACTHEAPLGHELPPNIAGIEAGARDIFDLANEAQWERADMRTGLLLETTARLEASHGRQYPKLERAIADLDHAIRDHDTREARRSANEVMRQAVALGSGQLDESCATILLLDVETREVLIVAAEDPTAADAAVARIATLWRRLRPEVDRLGQVSLAVECDDHVQALESGSATSRESEAAALLETLGRLERLFS